jgi:scaffold protein (connect acetoacetyl-CoA thiolase and HMG-CoA synthase)
MNLAKQWRLKGQRLRLEGQRHAVSGAIRFPSQPAAATGEADLWSPIQLSGRGEIWSFSGIRQAPTGFETAAPYMLALVQLAEGPLITAQLTDCAEDELSIGMAVQMVTRRLMDTGADGPLVYGYKFRPCLECG